MKTFDKLSRLKHWSPRLAILVVVTGLSILSIAAARQPAPLDFDGDGYTDFAVARNVGGGPDGATGWFLRVSGGTNTFNRPTLRGPFVNAFGQLTLTFDTQLGSNYQVQAKSSITQANWVTVDTIGGTGGPVAYFDLVGTNQTRFFRVMIP